MPGLIIKCCYYPSKKVQRNLGGLLTYIAKREGVEKTKEAWKNAPASARQKNLLSRLEAGLKAGNRHPDALEQEAREMFQKYPTKEHASAYLSAILENHPEWLQEKTYLDYIATRPRAERVAGAHGLFSDAGTVLDLPEEVRKLQAYEGNVYSVILSLQREDAERLGYNRAQAWMDTLRAQKDILAKAHHIPLEQLRWYGAFHNEAHHPHVHLLLYSADPLQGGYRSKKDIETMRRTFVREIFRSDLTEIYDEQTSLRQKLTKQAAEECHRLTEHLLSGDFPAGLNENPVFVHHLQRLARRLQTVRGKKVYGYLPPDAKRMTDELVDMLAGEKTVQRLYNLWYEAKCAVIGMYTEQMPEQLPLSQEPVFKSIRNAVIRCARELNGKENPPSMTTAVLRLGKDMAELFQKRWEEEAGPVLPETDSRLRREIEAKKRGQNLYS